MNRTKIEYCDLTWNPVTGCLHGCSYCYARRMAIRLRGRAGYPEQDPFMPIFHKTRLKEPAEVKDPKRILVSSMGDLFGEWVPPTWVEAVLKATREAPQHDYLFLTKNPEFYWVFQHGFQRYHWAGTTVCDQRMLDNIKHINNLKRPGVRFVSFEPLLGPIDLEGFSKTESWNIGWIIIGAQTNPVKQPKEEWIMSILEFAEQWDTPIFMKDNLDFSFHLKYLPFGEMKVED